MAHHAQHHLKAEGEGEPVEREVVTLHTAQLRIAKRRERRRMKHCASMGRKSYTKNKEQKAEKKGC